MGFFDFFPYTNFHNVNLDWVLQRVKEWGKLVEANNTAFHDLEEANASFKAYVETYLENLDVQAQIDDKLDRMFESGELTEYLQPYISSDVTAWLEENITEPTGVVIDSSLTVEGACADSKAVGDRFNIVERHLFSDNMKYAIMNCFRNIAFFFDNNSYRQLQIALFGFAYRYANLSDIKSSVGYENISMSNGTVTASSVETFAVLSYNKNYLRFYFRTASGTRFVFKSENNDFIATDGTSCFRFRLSGNKYTSETLTDYATITKYNGFTATVRNVLYYLSLENNTFKLSDSDKLLMTISNANILGYWGANNELGRNFKFEEVEIIENE